MKIINNSVVLLLTTFLLASCVDTSRSFSVMTFNIRHGIGMDKVLDLERTARLIDAADPDIVILNEVDQGTARSFGVFQTDSLGKLLGMNAIFGRSIDYDGGEYGNALLSKYDVIEFRIIDLSTDSLLEGRSIFISMLDMGSDTLIVMGTHLGLKPDERQLQIEHIMDVLPNSQRLILAGDFNFEPGSEPFNRVVSKFSDSAGDKPEDTFPADDPEKRIDYIFYGAGLELKERSGFEHPDLNRASDHRPVIMRFTLK